MCEFGVVRMMVFVVFFFFLSFFSLSLSLISKIFNCIFIFICVFWKKKNQKKKIDNIKH